MKTIKSTAIHLQPLPEYRDPRPPHSSYKGPRAEIYGPPLPAHIATKREAERKRQIMAATVASLQEQFGAGTVFVRGVKD
tara:strand:+ start:417 stop:656 length:240 start_codon:yes stop_codon:yes gene_type:complete